MDLGKSDNFIGVICQFMIELGSISLYKFHLIYSSFGEGKYEILA